MNLFCNLFGLHYLYGEAVKIGVTSEIKIKRFILYFARFALPLDKVGCTSTIQIEKTYVFSLYCLRFAPFTPKGVKVGFTSEIKINRFILYFARFALPLHKLNIIAYANQ